MLRPDWTIGLLRQMWQTSLWLILLPCFLPASLCAQGPWPRSKAGAFAQARWQFILPYKQVYGSEGQKEQLDREIQNKCLQIDGEYGLTRNSTLLLSVPYQFFNSSQAQGVNYAFNGLGNAMLGFRQGLYRGKMQITGTLKTEFPSGGYQERSGLRSGYKGFCFTPMLHAGQERYSAYWFVYGAFGLRSNGYSHFVQLGAETGIHRNQKLWAIAFAEYNQPLNNGNIVLPEENRQTFLYVNNQTWINLGFRTVIAINRFTGFNASVLSAFWGKNIPFQPFWSLGAYFKWD